MDVRENVRRRRRDRINQLSQFPEAAGMTDSRSERGEWAEERLSRVKPPITQDPQADPTIDDLLQHGAIRLYAGEPPRETDEPADFEPDPEVAWKKNAGRNWNDRFGYTRTSGVQPAPPNDEEESRWKLWMAPPTRKQLQLKLILCFVLYIGVVALFRLTDAPWADKSKAFIASSLNESFDFTTVAALYEQWFDGAPSFIPIFGHNDPVEAKKVTGNAASPRFKPVSGAVAEPFASGSKGVVIATKAGAEVAAMDAGLVSGVQTAQDGMSTVTIRHADQTESVYARLGAVYVKTNDWVKGGEPIGAVAAQNGKSGASPGLYLSIRKKGEYVNPADVIPLD